VGEQWIVKSEKNTGALDFDFGMYILGIYIN